MDRLLACDLSKAKLKFFDHSKYGYDRLYIAIFDDMTIEYFHEFYDCDLIVTFADKSRMMYSIGVGIYREDWRRDYEYIDQDEKIIEHWSVDYRNEMTNEMSIKIKKLDDFLDNLIKIVQHWKDHIQPHEAAAKIQAAFRGWKVRHMYRYDPYNCLGKYLALKRLQQLKL